MCLLLRNPRYVSGTQGELLAHCRSVQAAEREPSPSAATPSVLYEETPE